MLCSSRFSAKYYAEANLRVKTAGGVLQSAKTKKPYKNSFFVFVSVY